ERGEHGSPRQRVHLPPRIGRLRVEFDRKYRFSRAPAGERFRSDLLRCPGGRRCDILSHGARPDAPTRTEETDMGLLADWQIRKDITIEPFDEGRSRPGVISYGVSSYGYDVRVGRKFKVFTNARCAIVDPKNFDPASFVDIEGDHCLIPP